MFAPVSSSPCASVSITESHGEFYVSFCEAGGIEDFRIFTSRERAEEFAERLRRKFGVSEIIRY